MAPSKSPSSKTRYKTQPGQSRTSAILCPSRVFLGKAACSEKELPAKCNATCMIEFSARRYHDYRRVSCTRAIALAKRDIEECIKCGRHSWDTWHDKFRSVISLAYRPELTMGSDDEGYPQELLLHKPYMNTMK